jgi:CubicO group peptidase (beta-lactamase class C family)
MIRHTLALAALLAAVPATAQSQQEALQARYDRALAAGYKALMLCSAIANAQANGTTRTAESVAEWELTGIQAPLDAIVRELDHRIYYDPSRTQLRSVHVTWAEGNVQPRVATFEQGRGCSAQPPGFTQPWAVAPSEPPTAANQPEAAPVAAPAPLGSERTSRRMSRALDTAFGGAFDARYGTGARTTAVLVKRGDGVAEQYVDGFDALTPQRTWSVAKSLAATLIGAAVHRGEAEVYASAYLGANIDDPRRQISIDNALRMASGRYSDTPGNRTDPLYWGGATVDEVALDWPVLERPGTVYRYANNDTLAAVQAIEGTFERHPPAALFKALGMTNTVAETDWQGNYILSSQVWTTARDLARFGQLYLDGGVLPDGTRVLPENWVEYVSTSSGPQPEGEFGYGAGFWLLNKSDGVPPDTFAAFGNRGQYVVIVPSRKVVIVRRGEDPGGARFDIAAFTRDVLAALTDE